MSAIHSLKSIQRLPVSMERAWAFFSDPRNLQALTPSSLNLKPTNEVWGDEVYAGQVMTYTVKPLLGIPLEWMTVITQVERNKFFIDEQRKGPYRLWHHQHHFKSIEGGVEMTDLVHYRLPMGIIGQMLHQPLVRKKLEEIFLYRYSRIQDLFGAWTGESPHIQFN
jgi:ligand-binding SRPBCC domain-containing protein